MGDLIEFTTWPQHQHVFYKVTTGAIIFAVRGDRHAAVGLAKQPGKKCDYWIVIGHDKCWVEKDGSAHNTLKEMSNMLDPVNYNRFWVSWHSGRLQFGRPHDEFPLLSKKLPIPDLQFVTFSVYSDRGLLHWKVYLPPKLEKPLLKMVTGGEIQWKDADDQLPDGALVGGFENELLYIIRASHSGSFTPGKFVPSQGCGFISWGGEMHEKNKFEVLCGYNCIWVSTCSNRIPVGAVEGGFSEDGHETLYVGRAMENGHLIPGKIQPSHSVCYIPYNDREVAKNEYEILIDPQVSIHSPNRYFVSHMDQVSEHRHGNDNDDDDDYEDLWGLEHSSESDER